MTVEMEIREISFDTNFHQHGHKTTYTQVGNTVTDVALIEKLEDEARNLWHLEGECGFLGEVKGSTIKRVLSTHEGKEPIKNLELILASVQDRDEDYYQISISF